MATLTALAALQYPEVVRAQSTASALTSGHAAPHDAWRWPSSHVRAGGPAELLKLGSTRDQAGALAAAAALVASLPITSTGATATGVSAGSGSGLQPASCPPTDSEEAGAAPGAGPSGAYTEPDVAPAQDQQRSKRHASLGGSTGPVPGNDAAALGKRQRLEGWCTPAEGGNAGDEGAAGAGEAAELDTQGSAIVDPAQRSPWPSGGSSRMLVGQASGLWLSVRLLGCQPAVQGGPSLLLLQYVGAEDAGTFWLEEDGVLPAPPADGGAFQCVNQHLGMYVLRGHTGQAGRRALTDAEAQHLAALRREHASRQPREAAPAAPMLPRHARTSAGLHKGGVAGAEAACSAATPLQELAAAAARSIQLPPGLALGTLLEGVAALLAALVAAAAPGQQGGPDEAPNGAWLGAAGAAAAEAHRRLQHEQSPSRPRLDVSSPKQPDLPQLAAPDVGMQSSPGLALPQQLSGRHLLPTLQQAPSGGSPVLPWAADAQDSAGLHKSEGDSEGGGAVQEATGPGVAAGHAGTKACLHLDDKASLQQLRWLRTPPGRRLPRKGPNSSLFRGVGFHEQRGKWRASLSIKSRYVFVGWFDDEDAAARAYDCAVLALRGTIAMPNFPPSCYTQEEVAKMRALLLQRAVERGQPFTSRELGCEDGL